MKTPSVSREKRRENGIHIAYIPLLPSIKMRGRTASTQPPPRIIFHQNFFMRKSLRTVRMPTQLFALFWSPSIKRIDFAILALTGK